MGADPSGATHQMAGFSSSDDEETDPEEETTAHSGGGQGEEPSIDIDGPPPVDEGGSEEEGSDSDDDQDGQSDESDIEQRLQQFENDLMDKVQRRFDKAISKALKNVSTDSQSGKSGDDEDDDDDSEPPSRERRTSQSERKPDTRSMKVLARDLVADEMESAGSTERKAVKELVDELIPLVDWNSVEDEEETLSNMVSRLSQRSEELIRTGSDRKVSQLRKGGYLPDRGNGGQPAGSPTGSSTASPALSQMQRGEQTAQSRWPEGKRSIHS